MSSETSTSANSFRPWHIFVLVALLASTSAVVLVRPGDPVVLIVLVAAIGSASGVGFACYRMLRPLAAADVTEQTRFVGGRTRAALEREKTLVLRSIKELEFDHAMGKVSGDDFTEMGHRLRARALTLMKQFDVESPGYRDVIEQELARRLDIDLDELHGVEDAKGMNDAGGRDDDPSRECGGCGTWNEEDARFCKTCGDALGATE